MKQAVLLVDLPRAAGSGEQSWACRVYQRRTVRSAIKDRTKSSAVSGDALKPTSRSISVHRSTSRRPSSTSEPNSEKEDVLRNCIDRCGQPVEDGGSPEVAFVIRTLFRPLAPPFGLFFEDVLKL